MTNDPAKRDQMTKEARIPNSRKALDSSQRQSCSDFQSEALRGRAAVDGDFEKIA
jgi:hypothetical protein